MGRRLALVHAPRLARLLAVLALVGAVAPAAAAADTGRLVVKGKFVDTGSVYTEGAFQYLVIKRRDTGEEVLRREYRGRVWLNRAFPQGGYRLISYTRACGGICPSRDPEPCTDAACPAPGSLDPPSDRCARNFSLPDGKTLRAALRIGAGTPCRIRFSVHRVSIRGETRDDEDLARELRRYFERNAGSARWYHSLRTFEADDGVFTIHTALRRNQRGRAAADQICNLIQGSDLADFTPGHSVRGREGERIAVCPRRRE